MKNLALRLTLLGLFVAAAGVAAYYAWMSSSRARQDARALAAFDASAVSTERDILALRGAQQGYVAAGQGDQFWASKVDGSIATHSRDAERVARPVYGRIGPGLDRLRLQRPPGFRADGSARPRLRAKRPEAARLRSDFLQRLRIDDGGGLRSRRGASRGAAAVRVQRHRARAPAADRGRSGRGSRAVVMLCCCRSGHGPRLSGRCRAPGAASGGRAVILTRMPHGGEESWSAARVVPRARPARNSWRARATVRQPRPSGHEGGGRGCRRPVLSRHRRRHRSIFRASPRSAPILPAWSTPRRCPPFSSAPRLCSMHPVFFFVLWIADPDGQELSPIVTHGYPSSSCRGSAPSCAMRKTPRHPHSARRCCRRYQTDAVSNGAIAAPLVTPTGCVGVMAAEVRHAGEADPAKLAVAAIVAAQLATLVGPPSARAHARVEAAGA